MSSLKALLTSVGSCCSRAKILGQQKRQEEKPLLLITSKTGSQSLGFPNSLPTKPLTSRAQTKKKKRNGSVPERITSPSRAKAQCKHRCCAAAHSLESTPKPRSAATIIQRFLTRKWFLMEVAVSYSPAALLSA